MKNFSLIVVLLMCSRLGLAMGSVPVESVTPVERHGSLSVDGNRIVDKSGEAVSLAGVSLFWSNEGWGGNRFYNENTISYLKNDWDATIVRAAIGVDGDGSYLENPKENWENLKTAVDAAIENGIYVIVDWHSHHAEDYPQAAVDFFIKVASEYGEYPNLIYEIYNEPLNTASWEEDVVPYSEHVIAAIRKIDPDNLIVVGSPTWSQDVDVASKNPIIGYENIVYTLHFYAGTHKEGLRKKAEVALENGIALMVTEWGTVEASGDGAVDHESVAEWASFMKTHNLSHCVWAFNDKDEGASILVPNSDPDQESWPDVSLTESGLLVKELIREWRH
ncbi:glycoside hydrolase family 5 protein [Puniceicoccaceae bacterium K14]|nr:glycoside hydrolase family 5 protein [Puniceicoccaceae bacterium K14]